MCTAGFDMEIQPEEAGKPLKRDGESREDSRKHKGKERKKNPKALFALHYYLTERERGAG